MQLLAQKFKTYLQGQKRLSDSSIKNYVSDINQFLSWLGQSLQQNNLQPAHISPTVIKTYRHYLGHHLTQSSLLSANRRLSSLRHFGLFLFKAGLIDTNPCQNLANLDTAVTSDLNLTSNTTFKGILQQFKAHLKKEKLTPSTIKNYLSDTKQYLNWAQTNIKSTDSKSNTLT